MDLLNKIITASITEQIVITGMHSLWQGAVIAGLLWCILKTVKIQPDKRYSINVLALIILLTCICSTYALLEQTKQPVTVHSKQALPGALYQDMTEPVQANTPIAVKHNTPASKQIQQISAAVSNWYGYVFIIWISGTVIMLCRVFALLFGSVRLRKKCSQCNNTDLLKQMHNLKKLTGISRTVILNFSRTVITPCTIGLVRPVIILPAVISGICADDMESILLHELAHIKRLDWLVNIAQMFIESVLFFNPALWWISHQIRIEREAACDSIVVKQTKKPGKYANLLVQFASADNQSYAAIALNPRGSLRERIKRLIIPGYRPAVHPGIIGVLLTLIALTAFSMGTYKTTSAALRYFGKNLNAQQHAEVITKIKKQYYSDQSRIINLPKDQWIHVKGKIVTADNQPLPTRPCSNCSEHIDVSLITATKNDCSNQNVNKDGTFEFTLQQSRFSASVVCKGYAVKHITKNCEPGTHINDLKIILTKGYKASIKFIDPNGKAISNTKITGGYPAPPDYSSYTNFINKNSDPNGIIRFNNASEALMTLTCMAPGFQSAQKSKIHLSKNEVLKWVLYPTSISKIKITNKKTRKPIANADIYVNGKNLYSSFSNKKGETQTDINGCAVLDSLVAGEKYLVMIRPVNMQRQYFTIQAGDPIIAEFEPARVIKGKIIGNLSKLSKNSKGYYLTYTNAYELGHSGFRGSPQKAFIKVINDKEAIFQIKDYYGQTVDISAGNKKNALNIDKKDILDNILFNLSPQDINADNMHKIRFTFSTDNKNLIQSGSKFRLMYKDPGSKYTVPHDINIINCAAETYLHLPINLHWEPISASSFFFKKDYKTLNQDKDCNINIKCTSAGSIFGMINVPREFRYEHVYMRLEFINRSKLFKECGFLNNTNLNMTSQAQTKFMFGPLPLGGDYRVSFTCKNILIVSDEIHLTAKQPLCELNLRWPAKTLALKGTILNSTGKPAPNLKYSITAKTKHHSHGFREQSTDENGNFICTNINPDKAITYSIEVKPDNAPWYEYTLKKNSKPVILTLKKGVLLRGILKDHAGHIRANAEFYLSSSPNTTGYQSRQIKTDKYGKFQVYLAETEYKFLARHQLKRKDGRKSFMSKYITIHPGKDQNITLISDPSN